MASVSGIREGLANALRAIDGLRVTAHIADAITVPAAVVGPARLDREPATTHIDVVTVAIRVYTSRADVRSAQDTLEAYLAGSGDKSVMAALEADRTLGGVVQALRVTGFDGYDSYEVAGVTYIGAEFTVTAWAGSS